MLCHCCHRCSPVLSIVPVSNREDANTCRAGWEWFVFRGAVAETLLKDMSLIPCLGLLVPREKENERTILCALFC